MKHQPTSLLLKVLVVFACFLVLGPLGNASSVGLEMPREGDGAGLAAMSAAGSMGLSTTNLLTGAVAITPANAATSTLTSTATKSVTPKAPAAAATKSSTPTMVKPSATNSNTAKSASPTRTATRTGTASGTPTLARTATGTPTIFTIPKTPVMPMSEVVARTPTLTPTATVAGARNLTTTLTQTLLLPFVSGGAQVSSSAQITTGLGAEVDIDPALGGQLSVENGTFVIQMPGGAITTTQRLVFERLKPDRERDGSVQHLLGAFSLRALDKITGKETTQFSKPVTIQVRYDPKAVQGWRESDLTLSYWDVKRKEWMPLASTVDTTRHTVSAQTTHFSDYGLVQDPNIQPYLPSVESAEPNLFLGSATASYDFQLPAGRNGLVPKLSLSYSSSAVDMMDVYQQSSLVGTGWSLSTSYIARDIRSNVVNEDDVFTLVMNGSGYDLVKDAAGNYHTAQEQYWRIIFDTANNRWTVTTNDGTQYQYGYSDNSRAIQWLRDPDPMHVYMVIYAYWLEKVIDTHGNEIKYTYLHDVGTVDCYGAGAPAPSPQPFDNAFYPGTIEYNGTSQTGFLTTIVFSNTVRTDYRHVSTTSQCAVPQAHQKLSRIDVNTKDNSGNTQLVRRYELDYDDTLFPGYADPANAWNPYGSHGRLKLKTITQKGSNGTTVLSTYTATYVNNRLETVNNGIGGTVTFSYQGAYWFDDPNSPLAVWGWPYDTLSAGNITPTICNYASCFAGNGAQYVVLGTGYVIPNIYYSIMPGARYRVQVSLETPYDSSCSVRMALWDGLTEKDLTGWWNPPGWDVGGGILTGFFTLGHDARGVEIRLYANGSSCRFFSGNGTLYRTYYRVASRTVSDGQGNSPVTTYAYEGPLLNDITISVAAATENPRVARYTQFRGHSTVTEILPTGDKTVYSYDQDDVYLGRVSQTYQYSAGGGKYTRTQNDYDRQHIDPVQQCYKPACEKPVTGDDINYVYVYQTMNETWDGQPTFKRVLTEYAPDAYGNIIQIKEYSDAGGQPYRTTNKTFYPNTAKWILNKVAVTQVSDISLASETRNFYDNLPSYTATPTTGDLTHVDVADDVGSFFTQTRTSYDPYGNPTRVEDALGHATTTVYDSRYQMFPITITNPAGQVTVNSYDDRMGKLLTTKDPNNAITTYQYDIFGRTTSIWAPLDKDQGATAIYDYTLGSPQSKVHVQVRNDLGGASSATYQQAWWFYDGLGRVIQQQSTGLNGTLILVNTAYDSRGQTWKVSNPYSVSASGGTYQAPNWSQPYTQHEYDAIGREWKTTNPDGTSRTYNYLQWTTTITDENNHVTEKVADFLGRTTQVLEFNQGQTYTTSYGYNSMDRLQLVTNNAGNVIVTNYDWLGRKKDMQDPDLGPSPKAWTYAYDHAGNLTSQTDARGCTTTLTYDALNRVTRKTYTGAYACSSGAIVTYGYDEYDGATKFGRGRRTSMSDSSGSTSWVYDQQGRLKSQTNRINGATDIYTTTWTYDAMDRARSMTYPDGETVNLTYNEQTLVKSVTSTLASYVTSSSYNAANELTSLAMGNGETTSYTYDPKNLRLKTLQTVGASTLQNLQYGYDPVGNVKTITDTLHSNEVSTFGYDDLDRLISVNVTGGPSPYTASWVYNPIGNITQSTKNGVQTNYTYDTARVHAVKQVGNQTLTYDPNGNVANKAGDVLLYDEENRLQRDTAANGITNTVYAYNGNGQRVKREVGNTSGRTTTYYVGNWLEVETFTQATPTRTNTPPPTLTPTKTRTPTNTPVPTSTPTPALPGSGPLQTQSDIVLGTTLYQAFWRGDQGWNRTVPIVNGVIVWTSRSAWSGPLAITTLPGSGSMQNQADYVVGSTLWQSFWRGDQGWSRTVPIVNGAFQWGSASAWSGPLSLSGMPGSGALQAQGDYVLGTTIYQDFWRGGQRWSRTVPIISGTPQWGSASAWSGPQDASILPGSGTLQTESNFIVANTFYQNYWVGNHGWMRTVPIVSGVIQWGSASAWQETINLTRLMDGGSYWCWVAASSSGGSDGSAAGRATPVASDTERGGDCAPPRAELAAPARTLSGTVTKYYYFAAQRVAMNRAGTLSYLYSDHLGSTSVTANGSGQRTAEQTYYPYGAVRTGSLPTDYSFTGQKLDTSDSLLYYGARYYAADIGRFAQPDSLIPNLYNPQDLNRYSYVRNNPVRYTDPTGHCELVDDDADGLCVSWQEDDLGNDAMVIVQGGSEFPNRVEQALANYLSTGNENYLNAIPEGGAKPADIARSLSNVLSTLGYTDSGLPDGSSIDPFAVGMAGVALYKMAGAENDVGAEGLLPAERSNGETRYTIRGKQAHENYKTVLGDDYDYKVKLPSGKRPDAVDWDAAEVRELKPDNPSAFQRGLRQVEGYRRELELLTGRFWKSFVDVYKR